MIPITFLGVHVFGQKKVASLEMMRSAKTAAPQTVIVSERGLTASRTI